MAAQLRGKLGFDNELLLGFGVPPRKRTCRQPSGKKKPAPPAVQAAPGATPPPAAPVPSATPAASPDPQK